VKREYIVFIALFLVVIVQTVALFVHPAYRYYKQNLKAVEKNFEERSKRFEVKVVGEFLPAVYQAISNTTQKIEVKGASPFAASSSASPKEDKYSVRQIDGNYYKVGNTPYFDYNGFALTVGDNLDGTEIKVITPYSLSTSLAFYEIRKPNNIGRGAVNEKD
jgi:hypothetical protein